MSAKLRCLDLERVSSQELDLWKSPQASTLKRCAQRRDRHEILAEILEAAIGGLIKTHIMYKVKLSYIQLNYYLPILLEKGYLENATVKKHSKTIFVIKTSEKGKQFLEDFRLLEI